MLSIFDCFSKALPLKPKLATIFCKGQMVVLWTVLGAEIQKSQKISKFLKKIIEKIQNFWHKNLNFWIFSKLKNWKFQFLFYFLFLLRDIIARRLTIQNSSINVTYGPKNDKKNWQFCSNLSIQSTIFKILLNSYTGLAYCLFGIETSAKWIVARLRTLKMVLLQLTQ